MPTHPADASLPHEAVAPTAQTLEERHFASRRTMLKGVLASSALAGSAFSLAGLRTPAATRAQGPSSAHRAQASGQLREYWLQAEAFQHNLVPNGVDGLMGQQFTADQTSFWAIGYRAYTEGWGAPLPASEEIGANSGIPGPILRAAVGDTVRVHFRNNDTHYNFPHSIHTHGFRYAPDSDGAWTARAADKPGTAVAVGESYTYEWTAVASSVGTWLYHDHSVPQSIAAGGDDSAPSSTATATPSPAASNMPGMSMPAAAAAPDGSMDAMAMPELGAELGLFGMIAITDDSTPPVDREFFIFMHDMYQDDVPSLSQDYDCFNGAAFLENTPSLEATEGDRVRFRVAALGKEFHAFHVHGHRWLYNGRYDDTLVLGPATTVTFDFVEDNPGEWLYHCHVTDHMMGGMAGLYRVKPAGG